VKHAAIIAILFASSQAAAAPAWCTKEAKELRGDAEKASKEEDPHWALFYLVGSSCDLDGNTTTEAENRKEASKIDAARAAWNKKLAMTDEDWADVVDWANHNQGQRNGPNFNVTDMKAAFSAYSAIDQLAVLREGIGWNSRLSTDGAYLADTFGAKLTQAGMLGYIEHCIRSEQPGEWAQCQHDIDAFDPAKLSAELRADKSLDGFKRTAVRILAFELAQKLPEHAAAVKALKAKDAGYAKLFEIAEQAWKDWSKVDPKLVELAAAMDDARMTNSRKATDGCQEKTFAAWKEQVAKISAEKFGKITVDPEKLENYLSKASALVINDPNGYLAALALVQCQSIDGKPDFLARVLAENLIFWPGFRGPRGAAHTSMLTAGIQLDDRDAKVGLPPVERSWIARNSGSSGGGKGVIAKLDKKDDTVTITFKKEKFTNVVCDKGHYTHRVTQITSSGSLIYEYICEHEKTVSGMEEPSRPQTVKARYAEALKVGMQEQTTEDVVEVAYAKGGKPAVDSGVAVK
jgi:hypothetical protein